MADPLVRPGPRASCHALGAALEHSLTSQLTADRLKLEASVAGRRPRHRESDVARELYRMMRARASGRVLGGWSVAYLAARLRRPRRSVFRALARLEAEGRILRERTTRRGRGRSRNRYLVLVSLERPLSVTPVTRRVCHKTTDPTPRRDTGPVARGGQVLQALSAQYPDAPAAARKAWVALVNRMPPPLLELARAKLGELRQLDRLRCGRAVWYRWAVDTLSRWDVGRVPACARRHIRPEAQHWRGGPRLDNGPVTPDVAQLIAAAIPRLSQPPAPRQPPAPPKPALPPIRAAVLPQAELEAAARNVQELAFVRRWCQRRQDLHQGATDDRQATVPPAAA